MQQTPAARQEAGWLARCLPKARATPRKKALHGVDREVKECSDLDERLAQHVFQNDCMVRIVARTTSAHGAVRIVAYGPNRYERLTKSTSRRQDR